MNYAVIQIQGHQYKVQEGEEILVDKTEKPEAKILLYVDGDKILIGQPEVAEVKIEMKVLEQTKGEKIDVYKFKAKSNYRRHMGFRAQKTRIKIESMGPSVTKQLVVKEKSKIKNKISKSKSRFNRDKSKVKNIA